MKIKLLRVSCSALKRLLNFIMRSFIFFLCTTVFSLSSSNTFSQEKVLIQEDKLVTVDEVFRIIKNQTDYRFIYPKKAFKETPKIQLNKGEISVETLLEQSLSDKNLDFELSDNNTIVIKKRNSQGQTTFQQDITISGKVTDNSGLALPGATVQVVGTNNGTSTDFDGQYQITVPAGSTISISYVGYITKQVVVNNQTVINITLLEDTQNLNEIVVVGYGTQKKANLTGAVASVSGEVLENRPIASVGQGLQGVIPNLNVNIRNGDPAEGINFNVRGFESINGGNPLILVDGVPTNLNTLNPNDIESITVLKDAAAAAVYGARAAFGVILVETKKGKSGKMKATFSAEYALAKPIVFFDPVTDPYEYALARNQAELRTNGVALYDDERLARLKAYSDNPTLENAWYVDGTDLEFNGYNDYQNRLLADYSPQEQYNMSISGANDKSSYYASFGHLSKDGYLKNDDKNIKFKRYNVLLKGESQIKDWLKLDSRALISMEKNDSPHEYSNNAYLNTLARVTPITPLTFPDLPFYITQGDRADFEQYIGKHYQTLNFLPYIEQGGRDIAKRTNLTLTQGVTLNPLKGLNIRGEFSANLNYRNAENVRSKVDVIDSNFETNLDLNSIRLGNGFSETDYIEARNDNDQYYVFNTYADYTIDNGGDHYFKGMVGYNQEWGYFQFIAGRALNLITPGVTDLNATTGTQQTFGGKEDVALRGAFYRFNYSYKDKYLFEFNGRYDGTSRFPKEDRFGFFPSSSVGWRISKENFMSGTSSWLNDLKLRWSYGTLGNQLLSNYYPAIATMGVGTTSYRFGGGLTPEPYVSPANLVSPTLTWESVSTSNFGVDIAVFKNRFNLSFDLYTRETADMLSAGDPLPGIAGTDSPAINSADLETKGWEISATWRNRVNEDFSYDITLALSDSESKITKFDNPTGSLETRYVGQEIGEIWGFVTEGIFQSDEEVADAPDQSEIGNNWQAGDIRYADLNGDGVIDRGNNTLEDPGDLKIIGNSRPRGNFGINSNITYKAFSLNVFFQGVLAQDYLPSTESHVLFYPFNSGAVEKYYLTDTWSEDNRDAYFAAPNNSANGSKKNILPQSRYVQDGAYMRLKNLTLNYNLPDNLLSTLGMSRASIYASGMNLFEITNMRKPLDPEARPTLNQEYYKQRIYSLGLKVSF